MNPLKTSSVKKIVLKNTLKNHYSVNALIDLIVKEVKEIPQCVDLKHDIELMLVVCGMIENITTDSDKKIDKLEAIIGIYKQVFDMSTDDQLMLVNVVNFLHQNKTFHIKSGSLAKIAKAMGWFCSKAINIGGNFIH